MDALAPILPLLKIRPADALSRLLACWSTAPNERLADAIERYGAWVSRSLPPIKAKTVQGHELAWLEIQKANREVDVERLCAGLSRGHGRKLRLKLDQMKLRPPDPRLTKPLIALLREGGLTSIAETGWARLAVHGRDPRLAKWLRSQHELFFFVSHRVGDLPDHPIDEAALAALEQAIAACVAEPSPAAAALSGASGSVSSAQLLEALLEDPDSVEAAYVWCDALLEEGDPWGEVVALQLKRETSKLSREEDATEHRLIERMGPMRLGRLVTIARRSPLRFRRGLLDAVVLEVRTPAQAPLLEDPLLRSVRQLHASLVHLERLSLERLDRVGFGFVDWPGDLPERRPSPSQRPAVDLRWLADLQQQRQPLPVRGLALHLFDVDPWAAPPPLASLSSMRPAPGLPRLEELHLRGPVTRVQALLRSPFARSLRKITIEEVDLAPGRLFAELSQDGALEELVTLPAGQHDIVRIRRIEGKTVVDVVRPKGFAWSALDGLSEGVLRLRHGSKRPTWRLAGTGSMEVVHLDLRGQPAVVS